MNTILENQSRKQSAAGVERLNRKKKGQKQIRNLHPSLIF